MIRLGALHIQEFRGIRELEIDFKYESFAIHGPNGSGKSGLVDAVGFALTGTIARLKGDGTGTVSIKQHAPHVKSKNNPEAACISLTFKDVASGQIGTIIRTVKDPTAFTLSPDTQELRVALQNATEHPELTLSRREIIKYILAAPNKRAMEVQSLLQLDKLEVNRKALKSAHNRIKADLESARNASANSRQAVETHLVVQGLTPDKTKDAVNPYRKLLGLDELSEVKLSTNLRRGLDEQPEEKPFDKQTALREIAAYQAHLDDPTSIKSAIDELVAAVKGLAKGNDLALLKNRVFFETGLELIADEGICPFCDTAWHTPEELRAHLIEKIEGSKELARIDDNILSRATTLKNVLGGERAALRPVHTLSVACLPIKDQKALQDRLELLLEFETLLQNTQDAMSLKERLEANALDHNKELKQALMRLNEKVATQPDTNQKSKARTYLDLAAERWANFAIARSNEALIEAAEKRAQTLYDEYHKIADQYLNDLYASVESRFRPSIAGSTKMMKRTSEPR